MRLMRLLMRAVLGPTKPATRDRASRNTDTQTRSAAIRPPVARAESTVVTREVILHGSAYVIDGDTVVIRNTWIRLAGIDAPELDHPWGKKSKWALVELCRGQSVRAEFHGEASHDREVATCYLPDGRDLSAEMVRAGHAIDWPKFSGGKYRHLEPEGVRKRLWRAHNRQIGKAIPESRT